MLTNKVIVQIDLPHEDGHWIKARTPSLLDIEQARQAKSRQAIALMEGVNMAALNQLSREPSEATEGKPGDDCDWLVILQRCVTEWSYEEPVTAENIAYLDEETVGVCMAALFPVVAKDERKNASRRFTKP